MNSHFLKECPMYKSEMGHVIERKYYFSIIADEFKNQYHDDN